MAGSQTTSKTPPKTQKNNSKNEEDATSAPDSPSRAVTPLRSTRIFVNDVDSWMGANLTSEFLQDSATHNANQTLKFELAGTLRDTPPESSQNSNENRPETSKNSQSQKHVNRIPSGESGLIEKRLLESDVIVFHISQHEAQQVEEALHALEVLTNSIDNNEEESDTYQTSKVFILISSLMTWANTPLDSYENVENSKDEQSLNFLCDDDYYMRQPHPLFAKHLQCEKEVLKAKRKGKLDTYVVSAGLLYGQGEGLLFPMMQQAWKQPEKAVQVFGNGLNTVPTVHIEDLACMVRKLAMIRPQAQSHYLLCDEGHATFGQIMQSLAHVTNNNLEVNHVDKMEAFLSGDINHLKLETLVADLKVAADYEVFQMDLDFRLKHPQGLARQMKAMFNEFIKAHKIQPLKLCIVGPPAVGKSTLASQLALKYKVEVFTEQEIKAEGMAIIEKMAAELDILPSEEEVDDVEVEALKEKKARCQEARDKLSRLQNIDRSNAADRKFYEESLITWLKAKIHSLPHSLHGYILDGCVRSERQAMELFGNPLTPDGNMVSPPDLVMLNASDEFLTSRIQNLGVDERVKYESDDKSFADVLKHYRSVSPDGDSKPSRKANALDQQPSSEQLRHYFGSWVTALSDCADGKATPPKATPGGKGQQIAQSPLIDTSDIAAPEIVEINVENKTIDALTQTVAENIGPSRNFEQFDANKARLNVAAQKRKALLDSRRKALMPSPESGNKEPLKKTEPINRNDVTHTELESVTIASRAYMAKQVLPTLTQVFYILKKLCSVKTCYICQILLEVASSRPEDPIEAISKALRDTSRRNKIN
eukprot:m.277573 g.277573  ORF g.277573 m.277573 type:complete len:822 (+) comp16309_c0_seq1:384-2849(+)